MKMSFRSWLLQTELVSPAAAPKALDADDLIRMSGGAAMLTGEAPPKPWDSPASVAPITPKTSLNDPWKGAGRQLARRMRPITPSIKMMSKPPSIG